MKKHDGKWDFETYDDAISLKDTACCYKGLMIINAVSAPSNGLRSR